MRASLLVVSMLLVAACSSSDKKPGVGLVVAEAGAPSVPEAGATADISQCAGCQLAPIPGWTFEGIYKDAQCTEPLAQMAVPSCAQVPALGAAQITYVDAVGLRKANESAQVTLTDQVAPETQRFRKAGTVCTKANEAATDLTPMSCANNRVCRDATGALVCTGCRTFANNCPDFEGTRIYASVTDPGLKATATGGGGGNIARLQQCCNALAAQARAMGASPEAGVIASAAAQCSALVAAAGPNGNAPELGALKTILAGRNLPAVCAGF